MAKRLGFRFKDIHGFLDSLFGDDMHAKRVYSLANATMGVMSSASLAIHAMGQGLAQARGKLTKHAVKQVDRLLSNAGVEVWSLFAHWVPYVVGPRKRIVVAMDWTDFDPDGQATIMLSLLTRHGRATPLLWLTVDKGTLKEHRNTYEDRVLMRLSEVLPEGVRVLMVADRGFGDQKLYHLLEHQLKFDYVTLSRQHLRHRCARRDADSGRVGRPRRTCTHPARSSCDRRSIPGGYRGVCASQGHEGTLVSGCEHHHRAREDSH